MHVASERRGSLRQVVARWPPSRCHGNVAGALPTSRAIGRSQAKAAIAVSIPERRRHLVADQASDEVSSESRR